MPDTAPELHDAQLLQRVTDLALLKHLHDSNVEFGPYETALEVAAFVTRLGIAEYRRVLSLGVGHKETHPSSRLHQDLVAKIAELHGTDVHFDDTAHLLSQLSTSDANRILAAVADISDTDAGYMAYVAMGGRAPRSPTSPQAQNQLDAVKAFIERQKRITRFLPSSVITETDIATYEGTKQYPVADEEMVAARIAQVIRTLANIVRQRVTVDVQPGYMIKIATGTAPGATNYEKRYYDGGMQGAAELNLSEQTILDDGLRILKQGSLKGVNKTVLTIKNGLTDREVLCTDYVGNAKRRIDSGDTESFTGYDLRHNWDVTAVPKENTDA